MAGPIQKKTETDAEILARYTNPPPRPCNRSVDATCQDMHDDGYCICLTVACVFCGKKHLPHKECRKAI